MQAHQSSHVLGSEYENGSLLVQFANGAIYQWNNVKPTDYDSFVQNSSPGSFLHNYIRRQYGDGQLIAAGRTRSGKVSRRRY